MSFVFKINEELAQISVTATELLSLTRSITGLVQNSSFKQQFSAIIAEINQSYGIVLASFAPFYELNSEDSFSRSFDRELEVFKNRYLFDVSKPRKYCDNVYDAYLQIQQTREAKTGFPLLKRSFARLDNFYDKWVTNDALLAMSIDGVLKLKNRLLTEIAEIKPKDEELAYSVFASAFADFSDYLALIESKRDDLHCIVGARA